MVQKVARAADGELGWTGEMEANGLACALCTNSKPPRFYVYAAIPEAGFGCGDLDVYCAGDIEVCEVVACGGVGNIDWLAVDGESERGGAELLWNGYRVDMRSCLKERGKSEDAGKQRVNAGQETKAPDEDAWINPR